MSLLANRLPLMSHDDRSHNLDEMQTFYYRLYFPVPHRPRFDVDADDVQSVGWTDLFHADRKHLQPSNLIGR